jgi:hypothetical protein
MIYYHKIFHKTNEFMKYKDIKYYINNHKGFLLEEEELYYEKKPASCRLFDYLYTFTFTVLTPHWIAFVFVGMNTSILLPLIPPPLSAATA